MSTYFTATFHISKSKFNNLPGTAASQLQAISPNFESKYHLKLMEPSDRLQSAEILSSNVSAFLDAIKTNKANNINNGH